MTKSFEGLPSSSNTEGASEDKEQLKSLSLQGLREKVEQLDEPSEKLQSLIGEFDESAFPDNSFLVNIESNPEEPWDEGEEVRLSGYEEEGSEKRWVYEINPEMKENDFEELLKMAVHEVRHHAQRENDIKLMPDREKLSLMINKYPEVNKFEGKLLEYADKIDAVRQRSKEKLPPHIEKQEFDSLVVEVISPEMLKGGMSVQEVADEIIKVDADEMFANISKRLKQ